MTVISTTKDLKTACSSLKKADFLTVDTEFIREKTYWANLCLIQVADDDNAYAIDPLAEGIDLTPFWQLMKNKKILKVFHACRQDLEIFLKEMGSLPTPVFDTQIAAMVCGFGEQVGYEALVNKLANAKLDKTSRFTDWAQRPLTKKQLDYALADVTHLRVIYKKLQAQIEKHNRSGWIAEEMQDLMREDNYVTDPQEAWQRIRIPSNKPKVLGLLQALAAWREEEAQNANIPRPRVLKDDALVEIATHPPKEAKQLDRLRNVHQGFGNSDRGKRLMAVIEQAQKIDAKDCPKRSPKPDMPAGLGPTIDLLKVLLKLRCEENQVASKLVGTSADIELLAAFGDKADIAALKGWRRDMFGNDALALRDGKLGLAIHKKKIKVVDLKD